MRGLTGGVYGRRVYEVMRYWDADLPAWGAEERDFAAAWRCQPKWVLSMSIASISIQSVLGHGKLFFAGPRPPLHLVNSEPIDKGVIRLTYVPA